MGAWPNCIFLWTSIVGRKVLLLWIEGRHSMLARYSIIALLLYAFPALGEDRGAAQPLIELWQDLDSRCRGGSATDPKTQGACDTRTSIAAKLGSLHYCLACL